MVHFVPSRKTLIGKTVLIFISLVFLLIPCGYIYVLKGGSPMPVKRGFFCNDETIQYPAPAKESVPMSRCIGIWFAMIILTIVSVEIISFGTIKSPEIPFKIPILVCELFRLFFFYGMGLIFNLNITEIAKFQVGRLRPHFLDTCNITLTPKMCIEGWKEPTDNGELEKGLTIYKFVEPTEYECTNIDDHAMLDARKSFISGHASFSFYSAIFLVLYLQCRFASKYSPKPNDNNGYRERIFEGLKIFRPMLQLAWSGLAWWIILTRISDHKHHPGDVLTGSILGATIAFLTIYYVLDLTSYPRIFHTSLEEESYDNIDG